MSLSFFIRSVCLYIYYMMSIYMYRLKQSIGKRVGNEMEAKRENERERGHIF